MTRPYVRSIQPRDAKEIFGNLSQTNHFQVSFNGLPGGVSEHLRTKFGVANPAYFMGTKGNLLCSDAILPGSSLATTEVKDNFMGIPQEFAHTRLYTDIDFTFYVDNDYTNLRIFEGWIDYISSGSSNEINELENNYYRRMRYPDSYKTQTMYISKFEKDYKSQLDYQFFNAFPKLMTAIPVSYGSADILKVSVSFNYDRYVINSGSRSRSASTSRISDAERSSWTFNKKSSLFGYNYEDYVALNSALNSDSRNLFNGKLSDRQIKNAFSNSASWRSDNTGSDNTGSDNTGSDNTNDFNETNTGSTSGRSF